MPRGLRCIVAQQCYHLINRGNQKARVFHEEADYSTFLDLIGEAQERINLPILAACLMPNHVHLVVRPLEGGDLAKWMSWLFTTQVRRHHRKYGTTGRLWQGRYKAFLIQQDHHLLAVLRYVERNALNSNLVRRAEDWAWGSLRWRSSTPNPVALTESPTPLPSYWTGYVNQPLTAAELSEIRTSVNRQRPFGAPDWVQSSALGAGLDSSLVPPGRPRRKR